MCGRFTLRAAASVIAEQFALFEVPPFAARFNIAPTQPVPVVRCGRRRPARPTILQQGRKKHVLKPVANWFGCDGAWCRAGRKTRRLATGSSTPEPRRRPRSRPSAALRRRRCLVVADGFYEWQRAGRTKQPYFIQLRDGRPLALAGLWDVWEDAGHSMLETCTLLTTEPNDLIRPIHDRMPVILLPEAYSSWLDPSTEDPRQLAPLFASYPSDQMQAYAVDGFVNDPSHDSPRCIERSRGLLA